MNKLKFSEGEYVKFLDLWGDEIIAQIKEIPLDNDVYFEPHYTVVIINKQKDYYNLVALLPQLVDFPCEAIEHGTSLGFDRQTVELLYL